MQNSAAIPPENLSYAELQQKYLEQALIITQLKAQVASLTKMIFGTKAEKFVSTNTSTSQLALGIEAEAVAACSVVDTKKISYVKATTQTRPAPLAHPGRMKLPDHLRREEYVIEPTEETEGLRKNWR